MTTESHPRHQSFLSSSAPERLDEAKVLTMLRALAQPARLELFRAIHESGDKGVELAELHRRYGRPRSSISLHLAILTKAGLIQMAPCDPNVRYVSVNQTFRFAMNYLDKSVAIDVGV